MDPSVPEPEPEADPAPAEETVDPDPGQSEEAAAPVDDGSIEASFAVHLRTVGASHVASFTNASSASCGRARVLVCGSRSTSTFCRCVAK